MSYNPPTRVQRKMGMWLGLPKGSPRTSALRGTRGNLGGLNDSAAHQLVAGLPYKTAEQPERS